MTLVFPNLETLRLCLTSGDIPTEVSCASVRAVRHEDGSVELSPSVALPAKKLQALQPQGVASKKQRIDASARDYLCWPQLLPLVRVPQPAAQPQTTLFELPDSRLLPTLAAEMLRLGNDRQSFRYLASESGHTAVLLRVMQPPYYSLLRALDRNGQETAPRAYVEMSPRVWVEIGHTHPLIDMIRPAEGMLLLLRPPDDWSAIPEAPFQDIYEILEFPLPHTKSAWQEMNLSEQITVPLRLAAGGTSEPAELWVLRDRAAEQMETFVRNASDQLLARLLFAVATRDGQEVVILRARPSRQLPPVLVLDGLGFRPYLKLPNLFAPCQTLLHPPLRRDVVRRLLADDVEQITWLQPHEDGTFTPESIPDRAFRPLADWVQYVLSKEETALQNWIASTQFDFERFVCKDDLPGPDDQPRDRAEREKNARSKRKPENAEETAAEMPLQELPAITPDELEELSASVAAVPPSELQQRQAALEKKFLDIDGPLDAPERQALWPELAAVYAAQNNSSDAALCWINALWEETADQPRWVRDWHRASLAEHGQRKLIAVLDGILSQKEPSPAGLRLLASMVIHAAQNGHGDEALLQRLNAVQTILQDHEQLLPVRAVWLAALSLYKLTHGDVLALARTRDRLLERLFKHGLMPELDLPGFLRFTGSGFQDRFQIFRDWLAGLPTKVQKWLAEVNVHSLDTAAEETQAYARLILAFGFARLGEAERCRQLHAEARRTLDEKIEEVHSFLKEAFGFRIEEALQGSPSSGSLPAHQLEYLGMLDKQARYPVDRLRYHSRILEPHERIKPYRLWYAHRDTLAKHLAQLPDLHDGKALEKEILELYSRFAKKGKEAADNKPRILLPALELAPRIGQSFALSQLAEVKATCEQLSDIEGKTEIMEKALFLAAHFDQPQQVQAIIDQMEGLLQGPHTTESLKALEKLASQSIRGLRKLGMRETIHSLLQRIYDSLTGGKSLSAVRQQENWPDTLRSLLHVAQGWYYFGQEDRAKPIIDEARHLLYKGELFRLAKSQLACALVSALGQAPVSMALQGIDELLGKLQGVVDAAVTTNKFYGLPQLDVIETVVLSIITEDFAVGGMARRWLDEDEFLVRRRIHQDLHAALKK